MRAGRRGRKDHTPPEQKKTGRRTGRFAEALALYRDVVRASAAIGDWRLELLSRVHLVDLLWQVCSIDEAAREACKLTDELRARPVAYRHMAVAFSNAVGILSEMGRIDEASAVAREALPLRRARDYFVEVWAYLFCRRGQIDMAALLLGKSDAEWARAGEALQDNERRLIAEARAAVETKLKPHALARRLAAGAALGEGELLALVSEALAQPLANHQ